MADTITGFQELLKKLLSKTEEASLKNGFKDNIDQFEFQSTNYTDLKKELKNYWNESILDLITSIESSFPENGFNNVGKNGHDAGYDFSNHYVNPEINEVGVRYLDARTDELISVLKKNKNLDFTIDRGAKELSEWVEIKKYMTRLLMPQYKRRVEIEDLDRNFWVIGQNLTALNKAVLELGSDFLSKIIGELTGLWDNVYRIWQALKYLEAEYNKLNKNEKIRVMLDYGYGKYQNGEKISSVIFDKQSLGGSINYGILPYIRKKQITGGKWCYTVYYNEVIQEIDAIEKSVKSKSSEGVSQEEIDEKLQEKLNQLYTKNSTLNNLIKIDKYTINRSIKDILNTIRTHNFVLLANNNNDVFSNMYTVTNPIITCLDFFRDFIYYVANLNNGSNLKYFIEKSNKWAQEGSLQYIDFIDNTNEDFIRSETRINNNVFICFKFLEIKYPELVTGNNTNKMIKLMASRNGGTIGEIKTALSGSQYYGSTSLLGLVDDFYKLFIKIQEALGITKKTYDTNTDGKYMVDTNDNLKNTNSYIYNFVKKLKSYEANNSIYGNGSYTFLYGTNISLPYVSWDLLSMSCKDRNVNFSSPYFGLKYFYNYPNKKDDHLWLDFVSNITTDSYEGDKSTICSFTKNDLKDANATITNLDLYYDLNITVPLSMSTNYSQCTYHDIVRLGRPMPNLKLISENISNSINSFSSFLNTIKNHITSINNEGYYVGIPKGEQSYCIDGFYTFDNGYANYQYVDDNSNISPINDNIRKMIFNRILSYHLASSDMISTSHAEDGQTRIDNNYKYYCPILNLRFLNGRIEAQELEIILTKDETKDYTIKVEPTYMAAIVPIGTIYADYTYKVDNISEDTVFTGDNIYNNICNCLNYRFGFYSSNGQNLYNKIVALPKKYVHSDQYLGNRTTGWQNQISYNKLEKFDKEGNYVKNYLKNTYGQRVSTLKPYFILTYFLSNHFIGDTATTISEALNSQGTGGNHYYKLYLLTKKSEDSEPDVIEIAKTDYYLTFLNNSSLSNTLYEIAKKVEGAENIPDKGDPSLNAYLSRSDKGTGNRIWTRSIDAEISEFGVGNDGKYKGKIAISLKSAGRKTYTISGLFGWNGETSSYSWNPKDIILQPFDSYKFKTPESDRKVVKDDKNHSNAKKYGFQISDGIDLREGSLPSGITFNYANYNPWSNTTKPGFKEWGTTEIN